MAGQWRADPFGRYELRFHDGTRWTEHVYAGGEQALDDSVPSPPSPTAGLDDLADAQLTASGAYPPPVVYPASTLPPPPAPARLTPARVPTAPADPAAAPGSWPVAVAHPPRSRATAALLCLFLGGLGIHRFYTGQVGLGVALLLQAVILVPLTIGLWLIVLFVWVVVDLVLILTGSVRDQHGQPLA